jgi:hypothetical protein|tara:strand:+ start:1062 stop:1361 length:300 start_codon:yes stop_codon:yes gene_type:complete
MIFKMKITIEQLQQVIEKVIIKEAEKEAEGMDSGDPKETAFRKIVDEKQAGKVDGSMVDLFSASAVVSILDNLSEKNKKHYLSLPPVKMASIAFKMMKQ